MGDTIARAAAVSEVAFAVTLGVLIGTFLLATKYVFPLGELGLDFAVIGAYGIGVVVLVLLAQRRRRASRVGWSRRYGVGFAITMTFYAIGVALGQPADPDSLTFWIPYAVLTAAPLIVAALVSGRK